MRKRVRTTKGSREEKKRERMREDERETVRMRKAHSQKKITHLLRLKSQTKTNRF